MGTRGGSRACGDVRVVTELAPDDRPFGVDFLWDGRAALAVAAATALVHPRGDDRDLRVDMGLGAERRALRYRRQLDAGDVAVLMM